MRYLLPALLALIAAVPATAAEIEPWHSSDVSSGDDVSVDNGSVLDQRDAVAGSSAGMAANETEADALEDASRAKNSQAAVHSREIPGARQEVSTGSRSRDQRSAKGSPDQQKTPLTVDPDDDVVEGSSAGFGDTDAALSRDRAPSDKAKASSTQQKSGVPTERDPGMRARW